MNLKIIYLEANLFLISKFFLYVFISFWHILFLKMHFLRTKIIIIKLILLSKHYYEINKGNFLKIYKYKMTLEDFIYLVIDERNSFSRL